MKYLKALLTLLLCSALLCACAPDENAQTAAAPTAAPVLLGFSQLGSESAWRVGSTRSIEEAAERHGVSLMMLNAYQKQEKQIDAIRSFISYRVDVISFAPIVEDGWDTVLTEAKAAGIPVILVDRLITTEDESLYACFVGADFIKEGRSAGEFLLKKADVMGAEHLNIVEITGTEDSTPQRQRIRGSTIPSRATSALRCWRAFRAISWYPRARSACATCWTSTARTSTCSIPTTTA